jgi:Domain of unknown function (DUF4303)
MNFTQLPNVVRSTFEKALSEIEAENLCGFALYTDESAMSLSVSINSIDHLELVSSKKPENRISYQWSPAEWKHEGYQESAFEEINDSLVEMSEKLGEDGTEEAFEEFCEKFFEQCVEALEGLKPFIPESISDDFVLMFEISDYDDTDAAIAWIKRLNTPKKARKFARMMRDL